LDFEILYQDDHLLAVNKPANILVHRTPMSRDRVFLLQALRDQLGQRLYPVHRLDRATSGVLILALNSEVAHRLNVALGQQQMKKSYLAIVRGWADDCGEIDRPVRDDARAEHRPALTHFRRLASCELPIANRRHPTSRYSLLALEPITGRRHQLRIHCERMAHPIIGDTTHGDGEHNEIFRQHLDCHRLLLHAQRLCLDHPMDPEHRLEISCPPGDEFAQAMEKTDMLPDGLVQDP